jgi:hypothetical protein
MSAVTRNRELSQLGSFIYIDDVTKNIGIATDLTPNVGIGTTNATSKLSVVGDVNISGVVTASNFYGGFIGTATNATTANYAAISGLSTVAVGIQTTSSVNTSGIITASAFYINGALLINPEIASWLPGVGSTVYRLGNVGIGVSTDIAEKLTVNGNVSANTLISTVASGTSPFTVASNTVVTNLNADFLRGKLPPTGNIVGTTDIQTLINKTLTTPTVGGEGVNFNGSTSGTVNLRASATASGTLTLPSETGTLLTTASIGIITTGNISNNTIINEDISASAAIAVSKLASSTISGITLGNNLNSLSFGQFITAGSSYNGSTAVSISIAATTENTGNTLVARNASGDFTAGSITCSNLTATFAVTAADINSTSDLDLKTNVNTIENSLDIVNSLRGVSFDWKINDKKSYGVIAQELEQILPDLVTTKENKSVNYNGLVGVLIEAVKQLSSKVNELENKSK